VVDVAVVGALIGTMVNVEDVAAVVEFVDTGVAMVAVVALSSAALSWGSPHADTSSDAPITVAQR
jgi:hypothetical protein